MKQTAKISIIIGLILASSVLANFALAQTTVGSCRNYPAGAYTNDPNSSPGACQAAGGTWVAYATAGKADWTKAQNSFVDCKAFSALVAKVTATDFKAGWYIPGDTFIGARPSSCVVVPGDYKGFASDGVTLSSVSDRGRLAQDMETRIKDSDAGINSNTYVTARDEAIKSREGANWISATVGGLLDMLLSVLANFLGLITALAGGILSKALGYTFDVTTMPAVVTIGWGIVRDICNLFFILALIVMALATILRIGDEYNYKRLLPKLVLAALLVNFSLVISVTIMNAVNFVAATFYNRGIFMDIVTTIFRIANPLNALGEGAQGGWMGAVTAGLGKNVFMLLGAVVFLALTGMFVIRLVGLYVLIIFSPIAFVANILPATSKFSQQWWSQFIKYLIWAPVALFMIRLTILVVQNDSQFQYTQGGAPDSSFTYFILCGFLAAAFLVAQQAGMVGSKIIVKGVTGGLSYAGKRAAGYAGRNWNDFTSHQYANAEARAKAKGKPVGFGTKALFVAANPVAASQAWGERSKEKRHIASTYALATGKEIFGGKLGTPYREFLARKEEIDKSKEYLNLSKEQKAIAAKNLEGVKGHEATVARRGLIRAAIEDNNLEDIQASAHFVERYTDEDGDISRESTFRFLNDFLNTKGDSESRRFIASDVNILGAKARRFDYTGMTTIDPETGTYKPGFKQRLDADGNKVIKTTSTGQTVELYQDIGKGGQAEYAANEMSKLEAQERTRLSPQNFTTIHTEITPEGIDQQFIFKADAYGKATTKHLDEGVRANINRTQARTIQAFIPGEPKPNYTIDVKTERERKALQEFWATNTPHAKVLYAKKLGLDEPVDAAKRIKGFTVTVKGDVATASPVGSPQDNEPQVSIPAGNTNQGDE